MLRDRKEETDAGFPFIAQKPASSALGTVVMGHFGVLLAQGKTRFTHPALHPRLETSPRDLASKATDYDTPSRVNDPLT